MNEDPVVEEVHRTRERLLEQYGGLEGLAEYLRSIEAEFKDRVVTRPPKKPEPEREVV